MRTWTPAAPQCETRQPSIATSEPPRTVTPVVPTASTEQLRTVTLTQPRQTMPSARADSNAMPWKVLCFSPTAFSSGTVAVDSSSSSSPESTAAAPLSGKTAYSRMVALSSQNSPGASKASGTPLT